MTSTRIESVNVEVCNPSKLPDKNTFATDLGAVADVRNFVKDYIYCFENNLRENDSVQRTMGAIIAHPWVKLILETEKFDYDDVKGRDLIVQLYNSKKRHIPGDMVFVQVKSSWTGVREFIRSKSVKRHIDWTVFRQVERMVLVNGQFDDELILESFDAQLRRISMYYS